MAGTASGSPLDAIASMQLLAEVAQEQDKLPELEDGAEDDEDAESSALSDLEDRADTDGVDEPAGQVDGSDDAVPPASPGLDAAQSEPADSDAEAEDEEDIDDVELGNNEDEEDEEDEDVEEPEAEPEAEHPVLAVQPSRSSRKARAWDPSTAANDTEQRKAREQSSDMSSALSDNEDDTVDQTSPAKKRKREDIEDEEDEAEAETEIEAATAHKLKRIARALQAQATEDAENTDVVDDVDMIDEPGVPEEADEADELDGSAEKEGGIEERTDLAKASAANAHEATEDVEEEVQPDEAAANEEADAATRNEEEVVRKKAALDILSSIEKNFASLRDRLFAEKTQQLNAELEALEAADCKHPEFLAVLAAIDRRRADHKAHARATLRFKATTHQTRSIAERAAAHGQYMQSVQKIRDEALEKAGKEWYAIQVERRKLDSSKTDELQHLDTDRTQLVIRQQAYNTEVSVLTGFQKFVGFPAAPELQGASQDEMENDLKKMGIEVGQTQREPTQVTHLAPFPRQRLPVAAEQFLEQNPWANPQHPFHAQNIQPQQGPQPPILNNPSIRPAATNGTLYATPAPAKRHVSDANMPGSGSTIPISSHGPTPLSNDQSHALNNHVGSTTKIPGATNAIMETPSKIVDDAARKIDGNERNRINNVPRHGPEEMGNNNMFMQAGSAQPVAARL